MSVSVTSWHVNGVSSTHSPELLPSHKSSENWQPTLGYSSKQHDEDNVSIDLLIVGTHIFQDHRTRFINVASNYSLFHFTIIHSRPAFIRFSLLENKYFFARSCY